uniref:Nicastrin n=1 Tax=Gasterosteus aculeatus aculeatus TaxID=481459 RepID=A0AAQ4QY59_GASAC
MYAPPVCVPLLSQTRKMDSPSIRCSFHLLVCWLFVGVGCSSVEKKIYVHLNYTLPCVRLLNATHQIGCQSHLSGNVGVLHVLESEENLDWVLRSGLNPPYLVILDSPLFTRSIMMKLKNGSSRVAGVAVVAPSTNPPDGVSPHTNCPNENTGVYTEKYDPALAHCNVTVWNPLGSGLSYEEFDFPIFSLKDDNDTKVIRQCYMDHNRAVNGSAPQHPLCAMQLLSHMSAVTDTATCMRRSDLSAFSLSPGLDTVCDPLADFNVWASTRPLNNTAKGHKEGESVVVAAARLDSRSFFFDVAPGAESSVSGFVALLAAAHALRSVTQEAPPPRNILYAFFQGETFDYIGSSRMVYDMEKKHFVVDLDNIHSLLEIGQVGLRVNSSLWLHSDPVSRKNSSVDGEKLLESLRAGAAGLNVSLAEPSFSQPLPPSSFQRFLRARPIPGVVIQDHQSSFTNRFYESMYDNAGYLDISYPPDLTPEQQLQFVTDTATALTEVATVVARSLYAQAGGDQARLSSINADPQMVTQMLYGFLVRSNNSWFQQLVPSNLMSFLGNACRFSPFRHITHSTGRLLTAASIREYRCTNFPLWPLQMFFYVWVQGAAPPNATEREGFCTRSTVRLTSALSPAFDLQEYTSKDYSTWTESRWKSISGRIFLVAGHELEMLTLGVGLGVLITSLLLTYAMSAKADILFSSGREPVNATY